MLKEKKNFKFCITSIKFITNFFYTFISFRLNIYRYAFLIFRDKHIDAIDPVVIALSCYGGGEKERERTREREIACEAA